MSVIHTTLTDRGGNEYKVVSSAWLKGTVIMILVNLLALIFITALLLDNMQSVNDAMTFSDKIKQRNKAMDEMLANRAAIQQWMFNVVCDDVAKPKGIDCFHNPQWWAVPDNSKYNLIINDPSGSGLFPSGKENK